MSLNRIIDEQGKALDEARRCGLKWRLRAEVYRQALIVVASLLLIVCGVAVRGWLR